jgi:hypothetical protein
MDNVNVLQYVCNLIVLIGGVCGAIVTISHFMGKPIGFIKKRREREIEEVVKKVLPAELEKFHNKILDQLQEIIDLNLQQSKTLEEQDIAIMHLIESERDNLRYHIMDIYQTHKKLKAFPIYIKEKLDETYKDYKKLDGNHYIDKYYHRMEKWQVVDNSEEEEEI